MRFKTAIQHAPSHLTVLNSSHSVDFSKRSPESDGSTLLFVDIQRKATNKGSCNNICFSWQANLLQRLEEGKRALKKESARRASSCRTAIPARRIQSFRHFKAWRWDDVLEGCAGPDWLLGMLPKGSWLWWNACLTNSTLSWTLSQLLIA